MKEYLDFKGKTVVITGGRRGLGKAMAVELARRGAKTAVVSRSPDAIDLLKEISNMRGQAFYFQADLSVREERTGLIERICSELGGLDILINNAGHLCCCPVLDYSPEQWDTDMSVMLDAVFELSQAAARIMKERGGGKIIQIASTAAFKEGSGLIGYATAKTALLGMTRCLAGALAKHNINVNAIAPGIFDTDMNKSLFADPAALDTRKKQVPSGRLGAPEDIIGPVLFLASEMSRHVHGQTLVVDGGFTLDP